MSAASGKITQTDLTGLNYLFTDTGSYTAPITSRTLNQYDDNGNLIATFDMGNNLTQAVAVTADGWNSFVLSVVDAVGGPYTATVNYLFEGIYTAAFLARMAASGCSCDNSKLWNLVKAEFNEVAAEAFTLNSLPYGSVRQIPTETARSLDAQSLG